MTVTDTLQVELFVRSLSPDGALCSQEAVVDRLADLEASGRIGSFSVRVWGDRLPRGDAAPRTDAGAYVADRLEEFRTWARRTDRSLEPGFEVREVGATLVDECEPRTVTVPPMMTLAAYRGEDLEVVAPHTADGETVTVEAVLDALDADSPTSPESSRRPTVELEPASP